jgi:NAD(P)-dependent dehydrogenase (short-subunit alcohol dehydrogenase family)
VRAEGAAALVTGGASGLGAAAAHRLAALGAIVTVLDRDEDAARRVAKALGPPAVAVGADVTDEREVGEAVARAAATGPLRIVVHCAGIAATVPLLGEDGTPHDLARFRAIVEVNLLGTFNVLRLAAAAMARAAPLDGDERGVVVTVSSTTALDGPAGVAAYAASKAGVAGLTLPAARDLAPWGIRVVDVAPGVMGTPMASSERSRRRGREAALFPRRVGTPEDFARLVEHVVANGFLNALTVRLDGGARLA